MNSSSDIPQKKNAPADNANSFLLKFNKCFILHAANNG